LGPAVAFAVEAAVVVSPREVTVSFPLLEFDLDGVNPEPSTVTLLFPGAFDPWSVVKSTAEVAKFESWPGRRPTSITPTSTATRA
jgi:hypothetical protein